MFDSVVTDDFLDQVFDAGLAGSASTDLFDGIEPNDSEQFDSEQFGSALDDVPRAVAKVDVTTMNSNNNSNSSNNSRKRLAVVGRHELVASAS